MTYRKPARPMMSGYGDATGAFPSPRTMNILLVEDNPGDVRLVREALEHGPIEYALQVASDGVAALRILRDGGPRPDLVLLDLNLPKMDGRAVLRSLKEDPALRHLPVVVLTSSDAEEDVAGAYGLHANCYVRKPLDLERFVEAIHAIERFWLQLARLPPTGTGR